MTGCGKDGQRLTFTRDQRLLTAAAYSRVFDKARRSHDKWFTVLYRDNARADARLGLAISKKHCRRATRRNLVKRTVRESFRHHQHSLQGLDIVVINKPAAAHGPSRELFQSLKQHWQRINAAEGRHG